MKQIISTLICVLGIVQFATAQQNPPKLSPLTRLYLEDMKKQTGDGYVPGYVYKTIGSKVYVSAIIKVKDATAEKAMKGLGVTIGTRAGNIWTVQVPVRQVEQFTKLQGIEYIQLDEPAVPALDSARRATRVDSVHSYQNLWMPYTGNGVVMGIVDIGYDYGHPVLFDTTGEGYRVKKVWEQKTVGTPPAGFAYGNEMTDSLTMWAAGTDNNTQSHGMHVAGIAAGSGYGSTGNRRFRGMAYRSDLVLVAINPPQSQWIATGSSDMLDGINYVFQYAASVGKPAVVNLSWGGPLGPRDGTSLFNQAVDNLTGPGKIFVCSAGNNGENVLHLQKKFTSTDTMVRTFIDIDTTPIGKRTWIDIWGDAGKSFCGKFLLYKSGAGIDSTEYICLDNLVHNKYLIGTNGDTFFVKLTTTASDFNGKPRIFIEAYSKVQDDICLSFKGNDGTINIWDSYVYNASGYYSFFRSKGQPWAVNGNTDMTMSDLAVGQSAIAVGAYASKTGYTNINGNALNYNGYVSRGARVPFSSKGPSADGRVMPFITGPGLVLGSAVSSYDVNFLSTGGSYSYVFNTYSKPQNGRTYPFAMLSGTSMSAPAVSGIVAMMLEANHNLDPQSVKNILKETAIKDNFTGPLNPPDNNWGHGKVNGYGAVLKAFQTSGIYNVTHQSPDCTLFPNPSNGRFMIDYTAQSAQKLTVNVYDIKGGLVATDQWQVERGSNTKSFDFNVGKGTYLTKITAKEGTATVKTIIQ